MNVYTQISYEKQSEWWGKICLFPTNIARNWYKAFLYVYAYKRKAILLIDLKFFSENFINSKDYKYHCKKMNLLYFKNIQKCIKTKNVFFYFQINFPLDYQKHENLKNMFNICFVYVNELLNNIVDKLKTD